MWLLPVVAPGWFPRQAVDGSSTREIWTQLMGVTQVGLGLIFLMRPAWELAVGQLVMLRARLPRRAVATADWAQPSPYGEPLAVGVGAVPVAAAAMAPAYLERDDADALVLRGGHAALWRSLERALGSDGELARFAERIEALDGVAAPTRAHPIAAAMFRHRPQSSFVHLAQLNLMDFPTPQRRDAGAELMAALAETRGAAQA